ncbi:hypothetical protein BGX23_003410 [Mortierella sp. AD031]|nr:hypothetical protein BGX23_003410 [Mortierella sp. AD031]
MSPPLIQHTIEIDRLRDQPWICPNLEVLRCQFVRFERLKMEEQLLVASALCSPELINEDLTPLHQRYERSKSQHQLFFGTLAKLQNLRVLNLGQYSLDVFYVSSKYSNPYESGAHQVRVVLDSPSLTLYDGFDQLSTLRELEYLDFEGVDLRMSMQGIAWIATHWRKLKKVFGFQIAFNQYGYDWNADHKRTFLRENLKRLRSEIQLHDDVAVGCRLFRTNNASQENW